VVEWHTQLTQNQPPHRHEGSTPFTPTKIIGSGPENVIHITYYNTDITDTDLDTVDLGCYTGTTQQRSNMDPDVLLDNLRHAAKTFMSAGRGDINLDAESIAEDIVVMFDNLDHWLSNGGFIPA
jgi:ABC-type phosphate transport system ATPase subunit